MSTKQSKWIVVVPPMEPAIAERAFLQWKRDNPVWSAELKDLDIRIDTVRGSEKQTLRRYRVRTMIAR